MAINKSMQDYFQSEMQWLHEATLRFASKHPKQAARMNIDNVGGGRDPHIERLLEGVAYLNGRIKQQIDLGVHHVSEALVGRLAPDYLLPRPSLTLVELVSPDQRLLHTQQLPAGITFQSDPVGEECTPCIFSTLQPLTIYPLQLISVTQQISASQRTQLCFTFELHARFCRYPLVLDTMPLYIQAPALLAARLYRVLTRHVEKIALVQEGKITHFIGGQEKITGRIGSSENEWRENAFQLLTNYFHFAEQYYFVQLNFQKTPITSPQFSIVIDCLEGLADLPVHARVFNLHTTVAKNVFTTSAEPIRYHPGQSEYPLFLNKDKLQSHCLLQMNQVKGIKKYSPGAYDFMDFNEMELGQSSQYSYRVSQSMEKLNDRSYKLVLSGGNEEMHVSCDTTAFNGCYPQQYLNANSLQIRDERVLSYLKGTNILKPTKSYLPSLSPAYLTQLLSAISFRYEQITQIKCLKQWLSLHDGLGHSKAIIESIQEVQVKPFNQIRRGMIVRGTKIHVTVHDHAYESADLLYRFGEVLHRVFILLAPINTQIETDIHAKPADWYFSWESV